MRLGGETQLLEVSWTLTTDAKSVIEGLIDRKKFPNTLQRLARIGNWQLLPFFDRLGDSFQLGNLLLVDHIQESYVVEIAKIFGRRDCYDNVEFSGAGQCRSWARDGYCTESSVQVHCPLSCGLCKHIAGEPGQQCAADSSCLSGHCVAANADTPSVCLTDNPRPLGAPCGSDLQCASVMCDRTANVCTRDT